MWQIIMVTSGCRGSELCTVTFETFISFKSFIKTITNRLIRNYDIKKVCKMNLKKIDEPNMGIQKVLL